MNNYLEKFKNVDRVEQFNKLGYSILEGNDGENLIISKNNVNFLYNMTHFMLYNIDYLTNDIINRYIDKLNSSQNDIINGVIDMNNILYENTHKIKSYNDILIIDALIDKKKNIRNILNNKGIL